MSTKRIILISGYARSGKDCLATHLKRELENDGREARVIKFATALKEALQAALNRVGLGHIDVFTEDDEQKKLIRPLLVEFGKFARKMDKDVFVKALIKDMEALFCGGVEVALISDCRYLNETMLLRAWAKDTGSLITRLHIYRDGLEAANSEERYSIHDLNLLDRDFRERTFLEGDMLGIVQWAEEIVKADKPATIGIQSHMDLLKERDKEHGTDYVEQFINSGKVVDLAKVAAYCQPNAGTEAWLKKTDPTTELLDQVIGLRLTLERMDARLKRLEVGRG